MCLVIRRRFEIAEDSDGRLRLLKEEALVAELKLGDYAALMRGQLMN